MNRLAGQCHDGVLRVVGGSLPLPADGQGADHAMFRPQDGQIVAPGQGDLDGRIAAVFFLGNATRIIVELDDVQSVVVETGERRAYREGDVVGVRVDPGGIMTLRR